MMYSSLDVIRIGRLGQSFDVISILKIAVSSHVGFSAR